MKIKKWFKKQKGWVKGGIIGFIFGSLFYMLSFQQLFDYSPNSFIELLNNQVLLEIFGFFYGLGAYYGAIFCTRCFMHFFFTYVFGSLLYFLTGAMIGYLLIDYYYKIIKK